MRFALKFHENILGWSSKIVTFGESSGIPQIAWSLKIPIIHAIQLEFSAICKPYSKDNNAILKPVLPCLSSCNLKLYKSNTLCSTLISLSTKLSKFSWWHIWVICSIDLSRPSFFVQVGSRYNGMTAFFTLSKKGTLMHNGRGGWKT